MVAPPVPPGVASARLKVLDPRKELRATRPRSRRSRIAAETAAGLAALAALAGLASAVSPHPPPPYTGLQAWGTRATPVLENLARDVARTEQALASPAAPVPPALPEAVSLDVARARHLPAAPDPRVRDLLRQVLDDAGDAARLIALPPSRDPVSGASRAAAGEELGFAGNALVVLSRTAEGSPAP